MNLSNCNYAKIYELILKIQLMLIFLIPAFGCAPPLTPRDEAFPVSSPESWPFKS